MAAEKKATAKVEASKTAAAKRASSSKTAAAKKATDTKTTESVQTEMKEAVASEAAESRETADKAAEVKKTAGRKAATASTKTTVKKAELKSELHLQFGGNSYTQEELVKIAKDVWKYDLNQKAGDLTSIELYIKPEEHAVYYVMNRDFTGRKEAPAPW